MRIENCSYVLFVIYAWTAIYCAISFAVDDNNNSRRTDRRNEDRRVDEWYRKEEQRRDERDLREQMRRERERQKRDELDRLKRVELEITERGMPDRKTTESNLIEGKLPYGFRDSTHFNVFVRKLNSEMIKAGCPDAECSFKAVPLPEENSTK